MRRIPTIIGATIIGSAMPLAALAEDVVIRIEAKRGAEAVQQAAQTWRSNFPDVVTFPLADGWFGIALGPMPEEAAEGRLNQLKAEGKVPGDSFIARAAGRNLTTVAATTDTAPQEEAPNQAAAPAEGQPDAAPAATEPAAPAIAEPAAPPPPETFYIRIESAPSRERAEETLAKYREKLPEVGLWALPNGRFAVASGPYPREAGDAWLAAFRAASAVPRDAFVAPAAEMGEVAVAGTAPMIGKIIAPDEQPAPMPSLEDIQRALRWAGHYEGAIDGKDGPQTRAAIASEVVVLRASPDTATAMNELVQRREAWRSEIGLTTLQDEYTGLSLPAPMQLLQFDRNERALSIYGPKDGSGAALVLFSQPGGQQEMLDLTGLVTALGWVPNPERQIRQGSAILRGQNDTHIGYAEAQVIDGQAQGFVLIWPVGDAENQPRLAAEMSDALSRFAQPGNLAQFGITDARSSEAAEPAPTSVQAGQDTSQ